MPLPKVFNFFPKKFAKGLSSRARWVLPLGATRGGIWWVLMGSAGFNCRVALLDSASRFRWVPLVFLCIGLGISLDKVLIDSYMVLKRHSS